MRFAVDESGSFTTKANTPIPPVSVAVTLVVPDDELGGLLSSFRAFRATLAPEELKDGEPKGGKLNPASKQRFCDMLVLHPRVLVCPCIVDLGHFSDQGAASLRDGLSRDLAVLARAVHDHEEQAKLAAVSMRIANLSPPQAVRLYTWARSFFHGLHYAIRLEDVGDTLTEWDQREFFIDPVQSTHGSDEEAILREMLPNWMASWASLSDGQRSWVFEVPDEKECPHHSFRDRFLEGDWIDLQALLSGRVRFDRSSKDEELLQISDIAASITYHAARSPEAGSNAVAVYEILMRSCPYEPDFGIGLITPHPELAGGRIPNRFSALVDAMRRSFFTYRAMSDAPLAD